MTRCVVQFCVIQLFVFAVCAIPVQNLREKQWEPNDRYDQSGEIENNGDFNKDFDLNRSVHKRSPFPTPKNDKGASHRGPPNNRGPPENRGPPHNRGPPDNRGPPNNRGPPDNRGPPNNRGPPDNRGPPNRRPPGNGDFNLPPNDYTDSNSGTPPNNNAINQNVGIQTTTAKEKPNVPQEMMFQAVAVTPEE